MKQLAVLKIDSELKAQLKIIAARLGVSMKTFAETELWGASQRTVEALDRTAKIERMAAAGKVSAKS